jgi:hypothetical protein
MMSAPVLIPPTRCTDGPRSILGRPAGVVIAHRRQTTFATGLSDLRRADSGGGIGLIGEVVIGSIGALVALIVIFGSLLAVVLEMSPGFVGPPGRVR